MITKYWVIIRDPHCTPQRKGSFSRDRLAFFLREAMQHRPTSFIEVLTVDQTGEPMIQDGPEALTMLDGRSASTARKHNARLRSLIRDTPA